jgi:hypothetical protein
MLSEDEVEQKIFSIQILTHASLSGILLAFKEGGIIYSFLEGR